MMQKKFIVLISLSIIFILGILCFLSGEFFQKKFTYDGVTYALLVDGDISADIPNQGNYSVEVDCHNATGKWNYGTWKLETTNITGNISCNLEFTSFTPAEKKLSDYIMNQSIGVCSNESFTTAASCTRGSGSWTSSTSCSISSLLTENECMQGGICYNLLTKKTIANYSNEVDCKEAGYSWRVGQWSGIISENGFRYEGNDPDNYVWFNNEMWRIIGVFDTYYDNDSTHNYLTKLIRAQPIDNYVMHYTVSGVHWKDSSLKNLLNDYYYKGSDYPVSYGENTNACSGNAGSASTDCNFSKNGITSANARNMIANARWNNSGFDAIDTASNIYTSYDSVYNATYSSNGYVGLMYPSDYGYGALASVCSRSISMGLYGDDAYSLACAGQNWLYANGYEWVLGRTTTNNSWSVRVEGNIDDNNLFLGLSVRPVIYLKANAYHVSGDGSYNNPFIVGI